jgi:Glycosyltransferase family 10 (fucosyltransferase) C-term
MTQLKDENKQIKVKFLWTHDPQQWLRQFPHNTPVWGDCRFIFDPSERNYDWLVVYNDLPPDHQEEQLACDQNHTLLVTTEPSSIKFYGHGFVSQFGHVLTSQSAKALTHDSRIYSQPALQWFYGCGHAQHQYRSYDQMASNPPLRKTKVFSTVCSNKQQRHTLHNKRFQFTQALKEKIPGLEIFGHGVRDMADKAEALDDYRYHLAIENFIGLHHWTEKLADVFLGAAVPFYHGCPNAIDYFPDESFIPIDINDLEGSYEIISLAIKDNEYEKRLPFILEARRRVLDEYNLFAVLSREISSRHNRCKMMPSDVGLMSRHLLRKRRPFIALQDVLGKAYSRLQHSMKIQ